MVSSIAVCDLRGGPWGFAGRLMCLWQMLCVRFVALLADRSGSTLLVQIVADSWL